MKCIRCKHEFTELDFTRNNKVCKTCNSCGAKRKLSDGDALKYCEALNTQHELQIIEFKHEIEILKLHLKYATK